MWDISKAKYRTGLVFCIKKNIVTGIFVVSKGTQIKLSITGNWYPLDIRTCFQQHPKYMLNASSGNVVIPGFSEPQILRDSTMLSDNIRKDTHQRIICWAKYPLNLAYMQWAAYNATTAKMWQGDDTYKQNQTTFYWRIWRCNVKYPGTCYPKANFIVLLAQGSDIYNNCKSKIGWPQW